MSQRLTYFARAARSVAMLWLCAVGAALPGCFTVDDQPECTKDSECDEDEFCSEDDKCESSCSTLCRADARCGESDLKECENTCTAILGLVSDSDCYEALGDWAHCYDENSACEAIASGCSEEADVFADVCSQCRYTDDGFCDETTGLCPDGTDVNDCAVCVFTLDGVCDEGTFCDTGTDFYDCTQNNSCSYRYNGTCDEATYCSAGTDTYDCAG